MDSGASGNESIRRKRGAAKAKFRRKVKFFHTHVEKESSSEVLRWIFEDVEKSFDEMESIHMQLIEQRDSTSMDNEDQYMDMLEDERIECLESEAKELVRGVEDDFSAMMARLEEEYSHIGRILESILGDIRKLKPISEATVFEGQYCGIQGQMCL
ncbi:hypothetical protein Pcinc_031225 [Petrolisthes cinctipes]|uniref:Uncharacterized protein n=1 Tax=Petrolisthes cinctipes TaxID=88211 RepID=A0AAE1EXL7_PETCI|nr:hypothetical protein Pcinc_031224 [Petrolisthes cinctipes]KAK3862954.1 hypothetical protein Pcinc_031225 [Petrolisthes cinctipes]